MPLALKKVTTLVATAAAVGFASLFGVAAPATAASGCTHGATMLSSGVCELTVRSSPLVVTGLRTTSLDVLVVGGGGNAAPATKSQSGAGGGGGEVAVRGFGPTLDPISVTIGGAGEPTTVQVGNSAITARGGQHALGVSLNNPHAEGGASGNWYSGVTRGGGGGAGGGAAGIDGGIGRNATAFVTSSSSFANDTTCYGGGGAGGGVGVAFGTAICGGGTVFLGGIAVAPTANSGGGGGAGGATTPPGPVDTALGASGVAVLRWVPLSDVTVAFDTNGHGPAIAAQTITHGGVVTRPTDPTAPGFRFEGWYTDSALSTLVDFADPVTASTTYFASWTALITVSFNTNGHGGAVPSQTFTHGGTATPPLAPTEPGFRFNGWYTDSTLSTPMNFTAPITVSTTLYASWTALVTVTFDNNGHGGTTAPQTIPSGDTITKPSDPSQAGFAFTGWFTDATLATAVDFSAPVTASMTLHAGWAAIVPPATVAPTAPEKPAAALATTGSAMDPNAAGLALAAIGAGAVLLIGRIRRTRRAR